MKCRVKRHTVVQPLDESYRLIPLTQGKNAIVDVGDFEALSQFNWRASWNLKGYSWFACRSLPGPKDGKRENISMHRQILRCEPGEEGDHENHDMLDNRRKNLRKCSPSQNRCWRRMMKNNTSGFRGIRPCKGGKFSARINFGRKQKTLGCFATAEDAARAYDAAAKIIHGEFAVLNFPTSCQGFRQQEQVAGRQG
jgi:hypothetical protein